MPRKPTEAKTTIKVTQCNVSVVHPYTDLKISNIHLDLKPGDEIVRLDVVELFNAQQLKELKALDESTARARKQERLETRFQVWIASQSERFSDESGMRPDKEFFKYIETSKKGDQDLFSITARFSTPICSGVFEDGTAEFAIVKRRRSLRLCELENMIRAYAFFDSITPEPEARKEERSRYGKEERAK